MSWAALAVVDRFRCRCTAPGRSSTLWPGEEIVQVAGASWNPRCVERELEDPHGEER